MLCAASRAETSGLSFQKQRTSSASWPRSLEAQSQYGRRARGGREKFDDSSSMDPPNAANRASPRQPRAHPAPLARRTPPPHPPLEARDRSRCTLAERPSRAEAPRPRPTRGPAARTTDAFFLPRRDGRVGPHRAPRATTMDHDPSPGDDAATLRARLAHAIANLPEALRACASDALANRVAPIFAEDDYERCAARARRAPAPQHHRSITTAPSSYTPRGEDPKKSATTIHPSRPLAAAHAAAPPSRRLTSPPQNNPARARPRPARVPPAPSLPSSRERDWVAALGAPRRAGSIRRGGAPAPPPPRSSAIAAADDPTPSRERKNHRRVEEKARVLRRSFEPPPRGRRRGARGVRGVRSSPRGRRRRRTRATLSPGRAPRTGDEAVEDKNHHSPPSANSPGGVVRRLGWGRGPAASRRRRGRFHLLRIDVDARRRTRNTRNCLLSASNDGVDAREPPLVHSRTRRPAADARALAEPGRGRRGSRRRRGVPRGRLRGVRRRRLRRRPRRRGGWRSFATRRRCTRR